MFIARTSLISVIVTMILGAICLSAQTPVGVQNSQDLASEQVENFRIDTDSIGVVFSDLSLIYDVPIGLEIAAHDNESERYSVDFKKGTVTQLLTQFVTQHPQYTWKIEEGVVNIFPKDGYRDRMFEDILATRMEKFSVNKNTSCWNFIESLFTKPELKTILEANKTTHRGRAPSGFYSPQLGRGFTLDVSDLTLRSLLNKVVSKSSIAKFWVITRNRDSTLSVRLSARHEDSIWTKGKRPSQQLLGDQLPKQ